VFLFDQLHLEIAIDSVFEITLDDLTENQKLKFKQIMMLHNSQEVIKSVIQNLVDE